MSVYKYDDTTHQMREYDIAYQVEDNECLPPPNGIENMTRAGVHKIDKFDNTWLPYLHITNGEIRMSSTEFINDFYQFFVEPTDVPFILEDFDHFNGKQIYVNNNNARWGSDGFNIISHYSNDERRYTAVIDDNTTGYNYHFMRESGGNTVLAWIPNGELGEFCMGIDDLSKCIAVINALNITGVGGKEENHSGVYGTIYLNEELHQIMIDKDDSNWDTYYEPNVIDYTAAETEWLENYFNIEQDGDTFEWYESSFSNPGGKYIRLKKNNTTLAELPYWEEDDLVEDFGKNFTFSDVTKTGSITYHGLTKSYSITQKAMHRTIKARMYMNVVEEDGKTYNHFNVWPYDAEFDLNNSGGNQYVNSIKAIRYKKVSDSQWTAMTLPTRQSMIQLGTELGNSNPNIRDVYTLELQDSGYYDIEWILDVNMPLNDWEQEGWRITFTDSVFYYNFDEHYYEQRYNQDLNIPNTPWIISFDGGGQYATDFTRMNNSPAIREWDDWTCTLDCFSVSDGGEHWGETIDSILTRQVKNIVFNNFTNESNWYSVLHLNADALNVDGLNLFYNTTTRNRFDDTNWFMGVYPRCTKLYLHPTIYAMTNHGFDNSIPGWYDWQLDDFLNNGGELYELPNNWRTLIPNYIGE